MTADETPSRIDRVFGDGSLVNETLRLAPREAIDRHQRLVPASQIDDVGLLLTDDELLKERTARDLGRWFEARLALVNGCPAAKRPALLHQGAFKRFYEEMYPFAHFVRHLVGDRKDVTCRLTSPSEGAPHCDAVIRDVSTRPVTTTFVELTTTTFDRDQAQRMRYFLKHGWVPAWGHINAADEAEFELYSHEEKLNQTFEGIERAARRKARFSHGPGYALVVSFDDFMWFGTEDDRAALRAFVDGHLAGWHLNVGLFYVIGISGRTFLAFEVTKSESGTNSIDISSDETERDRP